MSFVLQDPTGAALQDLRVDTPDLSAFRKFLVYNNNLGAGTGLTLQVQETGFSRTDQSYLTNRAVISASYVHSVRGAETSSLATGPVSTLTQLPLELSLTILDGLLQLSPDTFSWGPTLALATLAAQSSIPAWLRYLIPTFPFTTRLTLKNIGSATFSNISLTPPATDQLSTDGQTYQSAGASISVGTLHAGGSVTFWLRSISIQNLIAAQLQLMSGGSGLSQIPIQAAGSRAYCLVKDVRAFLKRIDIDDVTDDEEIMNLITTSAKDIDRATRRRFDVCTVTEQYNGNGQQMLVLDNYPLLSVQEVQIKNMANQLVTDIRSTDANFAQELIIDFVRGYLTLPPAAMPYSLYPPYTGWFWPSSSYVGDISTRMAWDYSSHFGAGVRNVVVTYTYGFQQPPEPIRMACMKLTIIELLKKKGSADSQGMATEGMAGATFQYTARGMSGGAGPFGHIIAELQQDVEADLEKYRKRSWKTV
jgi:hypothetical protein